MSESECDVARQSQVNEQMDHLDSQVKRLGELTHMLVEKLVPITRDEPSGTREEKKDEVLVPTANAIMEQRAQVAGYCDVIESLLRQIEL